MNCEAFQEHIALSLYGELSAAETAALELHLRGCVECRAVREQFAGTVALLRGRATPARASRRALAVAAAVLLLGCGSALSPLLHGIFDTTDGRSRTPGVVANHGASAERPRLPVDRVAAALAAGTPEARARVGALSLREEDQVCAVLLGDAPTLAFHAAEWLGEAGTSRVVPALREALSRPGTRLAAFRALRRRGALSLDRDLVPALDDPLLYRDAVEVLVAQRNEAAFRLLLERAARQPATLTACRKFPASVALPALTAAAEVRALLPTVVEMLLTTDGDPYRNVLLECCEANADARALAVTRAARDLGDPRAARFLVLALARPALTPATRAILAPVPILQLRSALATALREDPLRAGLVDFLVTRAGECAARDLLVDVLGDDTLRGRAAHALLERGDLRAVPELLRAGRDQDLAALAVLPADVRRRELTRALRQPALRPGALRAAGSGDAGLWRELIALLPAADRRAEVAAALARIGARHAVPFLIPYLGPQPSAPDVKAALVELAGVDLGDQPGPWGRWWSQSGVR